MTRPLIMEHSPSVGPSMPALPPGQRTRADFPRFGANAFAAFQAPISTPFTLLVAGDIEPISLGQDDLAGLERRHQVADFSCVTTWSYRGLTWSGFRFRDLWEQLVQPRLASSRPITLAAFSGLDGYKASLLLDDALAADVFIADALNGEPLSSEHGAPLRLVAPAHYGYKNVKHLCTIEFWQTATSYRSLLPSVMEHPRARVAYEERGRILPGWVFRYLYRPLIGHIVRTMNEHSSTRS